MWPHYAAAFYAIGLQAMRQPRPLWAPEAKPVGLQLVRILISLFAFSLSGLRPFTCRFIWPPGVAAQRLELEWCRTAALWNRSSGQIESRLDRPSWQVNWSLSASRTCAIPLTSGSITNPDIDQFQSVWARDGAARR